MAQALAKAPAEDSSPADFIARVEARASIEDVFHVGKRIRWRRFGSGAPLVLLHGGHGSWLHWMRNVEALSARHTVWVADMPGFHDSDALDPVPVGKDRLAPTINALASTLNVLIGTGNPFDLAGFSFGGLVASRLAVECGNVRRLALLGTAGHGMGRRQITEMVDWKACVDPASKRAALQHNLGALMLHDMAQADALALAIYEQSCIRTQFRSKAISRAGGLQELLNQFHGPLLMLWGEHDVTAHPRQVAEALRGDRPERDWCLLSGAGHWVQYERAPDVNHLLLSWFEWPET
jgi:pimeloyl-ACP methyl ester carboxylesterase